jgi:hypothetical protein
MVAGIIASMRIAGKHIRNQGATKKRKMETAGMLIKNERTQIKPQIPKSRPGILPPADPDGIFGFGSARSRYPVANDMRFMASPASFEILF